MGKVSAGLIYAIAMSTVIVAMDLLFFRHHFTERLLANIGVALLFGAFYWRFFKRK